MPSRPVQNAIRFLYVLDVEMRLKWTPLGVRTHLVGVPLLLFCRCFVYFPWWVNRSKGPCDVFDPWVCWERGQVGI